jgi:hypothetical protein
MPNGEDPRYDRGMVWAGVAGVLLCLLYVVILVMAGTSVLSILVPNE